MKIQWVGGLKIGSKIVVEVVDFVGEESLEHSKDLLLVAASEIEYAELLVLQEELRQFGCSAGGSFSVHGFELGHGIELEFGELSRDDEWV